MMNIITIPVGVLETNCYIVYDDNKVGIVIDPGYEAKKIIETVNKNGIKIEYVVLTHGHMDHITGAQEVKEVLSAKTIICETEAPLLVEPLTSVYGDHFKTEHKNTAADITVVDGDIITFGDLSCKVMNTRGHTAGSICLIFKDDIFAGDTLFFENCGRCDLPTGSYDEMLVSLKRISLLEGDYNIYCGHGVPTTLSHERRYNQYMKEGVACK